MKVSLWFVATSALLLVACSSNQTNQEPEQQGQGTSAGLPPQQRALSAIEASCRNVGGNLAVAHQLDGSAVEMCQLSNGKRCEMWAVTSGACPAG
jgi:putative hemolysin